MFAVSYEKKSYFECKINNNEINMNFQRYSGCVIIAVMTIISQKGFAQGNQTHQPKDSIVNMESDSLLESQQKQKNDLLSKADSTHKADSLQQLNILQQISELRIRDVTKKKQLQAKLDSLKEETELRNKVAKDQIDSLRAYTLGIPVVLYEDTLFNIYSKLGPFSPRDRAVSIVQKLKLLIEEGVFDASKLIVFAGIESHDIIHEELIVLSITDRDAFWLDKTREEVAMEYSNAIQNSISVYMENTGLMQNLKRLGLAMVTVILFFLAVVYMNKGFTWLNRYLLKIGKKYIKGVSIKSYEFLSVASEEKLLIWILKMMKWISIILMIYLLLPIVFSIFPATKGIASTLINYILDPLKLFGAALIGYMPELITIVVIVVMTNYFVRFLKFLSFEIQHGNLIIAGFYPDWAVPTFNLVRIIIYAFSFIIIFPYLPGSDSAIFQGVSVFLGILFSLGSSSAISNIIAGLVITYMRAFKIGDRVKIGDTVGDVLGKSMLVTRLRTIDNEDVTIPNSSILNGKTVNFSTSAKELGLILKSTITIGYDVPWREVHKLLIDAALQTDHIKPDPLPFVLQTSLDDFFVSYQIKGYTEQPGMASKIYSQLHGNIQDAFNTAGIEIMSPHYRGNRDGNTVTIPVEYTTNNLSSDQK